LRELGLTGGSEVCFIDGPELELVTLKLAFFKNNERIKVTEIEKVNLAHQFHSFYNRLLENNDYKTHENTRFQIAGNVISPKSTESLRELGLTDGSEICVIDGPELVTLNLTFFKNGERVVTIKIEKVNLSNQFQSFYKRLVQDNAYKTHGNTHFEIAGDVISARSTESLQKLGLTDGSEVCVIDGPNPFNGMSLDNEKRTIGPIDFNNAQELKPFLRPVNPSLFTVAPIQFNYTIARRHKNNYEGLSPAEKHALIDYFGTSQRINDQPARFYENVRKFDDTISGMLIFKTWNQIEAEKYGFKTPGEAVVGIEILLSRLKLVIAKAQNPGIGCPEFHRQAHEAALRIESTTGIDVDDFLYDMVMDAFSRADFVN